VSFMYLELDLVAFLLMETHFNSQHHHVAIVTTVHNR
jgi:hypothetical protein